MSQDIEEHLNTVSQPQRERLFNIDFKLYFLGSINRTDLVSRFGIKEAAASRDLSLYKELAPKNIEYDTKARTYIQREGFAPLFNYSGSQALAALLHGFGDDFVGSQKSMIACEAPTRLNYPNIEKLAFVTRAIYNQQILEVNYHSLAKGITSREIVPFALIDNGLQWLVRGFDRTDETFADYILNRIESTKLFDDDIPEEQTKAADNQWNRIVELQLVPHPRLSHPQTIKFEYGIQNDALTIEVRAALTGYLLRNWNIDCSDDHSLEDEDILLWLRNNQAIYGVENTNLAPGYRQMETNKL